MAKRMLDLFCGRWGWSKAFAEHGWECVGVDLTEPPDIPTRCTFLKMDVLTITPEWIAEQGFDFICASSPCEKFSVHGMKHFHPNPPYPELGLKFFNHTRMLCETSGLPYVMENVRAAQQFVGTAVQHCGSFYLWGSGVPTLMPQGIKKGMRMATGGIEGMNLPGSKRFRDMTAEQKRAVRKTDPMLSAASVSAVRKKFTAKAATIPPELASCVVDYAERLLETRRAA